MIEGAESKYGVLYEDIKVKVHRVEPLVIGGRYLLFLRKPDSKVGDTLDSRRFEMVRMWPGSLKVLDEKVHVPEASKQGLRNYDGFDLAEVRNELTRVMRQSRETREG